MSTTLRLLTLRSLRKLGVKQFRTQSSAKLPFLCHLGDSLSENAFYNPACSLTEVVLMGAWCKEFESPTVYDIGGHVGFIATQLAQLIRDKQPRIYSFEPVSYTFSKLVKTISFLKLDDCIFPVCCAVSDRCGLVQMSYCEWDAMLAQITSDGPNLRAGDKVLWTNSLTVDSVVASIGKFPNLIKVDVEGYELAVFKGAKELLSQSQRPALHFELNPVTLREMGSNGHHFHQQLEGYKFYFVNEVEGRRNAIYKFAQPIKDLTTVAQVINVFAVPDNEIAQQRWQHALIEAEKIFDSLHVEP